MSDTERPLVIIKKDFGEEPAPHGGGWKVAMADLMISMFALFLILWLLQILDSEDQEKLIEYFKSGGELEVAGGDALVPGFNSISPVDLPNVATSHYETDLHRVNDTSLLEGELDSEQQLELLATKVRERIDKLNGTSSVTVKVTNEGLRLVLHDSERGSMFIRGSARLTHFYEDLLLGLAPIFNDIENNVMIVGHTDASKYVGSQTSNWELSAQRAGQARYYLERGGMPQNRVFQVSGLGDTKPINKADPKSAVNRRVELFILTKKAREEMEMIFDGALDIDDQTEADTLQQLENVRDEAEGYAEGNQGYTGF